ncbi:hypothetical protein PM395_gp56 [Xanthomonas phage Samson]|uniref:Uncharacterized protein n=1 Tax=Xanthomonas phage Samson TaxID=2596676 RepID=A0A5B9NBC0_9CAUD|nr:hypothetical protein PM395_gp56 [Xanthomonas phage Samson]QEG09350.1 hypothetical protein Samson_035 [Xanthomonas phage Samson]
MNSNIIQVTNPETGEVKNYSEAEYIAERDRLLVDWQAKKAALEVAKEAELEARKLAVMFMHDPAKSGTTENVELGGGYKATMKVPVRYGFVQNAEGKTDKARIEKALSKIEKTGQAGELIAERLVKWTPELSLTEYKQLPDNFRKIIDDVIVTSEGTPTLEIKEPKAKK